MRRAVGMPQGPIQIQTRAGRVVAHVAGDGAPIVLLHAVGHDHHDFDAIASELGESFRTIAVDWPGHGASEMFEPPSSASAARMCDVLEDVVDGLGISGAAFVGNSVGGTASVRLAARRPDLVRALVLVDTGGFSRQTPVTRAFCWFMGHALVRRLVGMAFARAYLRRRNGPTRALLARLEAGRRREGALEMEAAMWRSFGGPGNDVVEEARAVHCPTLVVWGRRDPVLPLRSDGRRVRDAFAGARFEELDTGHVPFVEEPGGFMRALAPFLSSLPPLTSSPAS